MYYMYRNLIDSLFILIITFDYIRCVMLLFWKKKSCFILKKKQAGSVTLFTNRSSFQSASQLASVVERNLIFTLSVGLFFPKMAATKELSALTL